MRISDWSSDVCSSDLEQAAAEADGGPDGFESVSSEFLRHQADFRARGAVVLDYVVAIGGDGAATGLGQAANDADQRGLAGAVRAQQCKNLARSEEHTSELQSLMRISYTLLCLKKNTNNNP